MLDSINDCLSCNHVEIFHQYQNHQKFDLLTTLFFCWVTCWPLIHYAIFSIAGHNFHVRLQTHVEDIWWEGVIKCVCVCVCLAVSFFSQIKKKKNWTLKVAWTWKKSKKNCRNTIFIFYHKIWTDLGGGGWGVIGFYHRMPLGHMLVNHFRKFLWESFFLKNFLKQMTNVCS